MMLQRNVKSLELLGADKCVAKWSKLKRPEPHVDEPKEDVVKEEEMSKGDAAKEDPKEEMPKGDAAKEDSQKEMSRGDAAKDDSQDAFREEEEQEMSKEDISEEDEEEISKEDAEEESMPYIHGHEFMVERNGEQEKKRKPRKRNRNSKSDPMEATLPVNMSKADEENLRARLQNLLDHDRTGGINAGPEHGGPSTCINIKSHMSEAKIVLAVTRALRRLKTTKDDADDDANEGLGVVIHLRAFGGAPTRLLDLVVTLIRDNYEHPEMLQCERGVRRCKVFGPENRRWSKKRCCWTIRKKVVENERHRPELPAHQQRGGGGVGRKEKEDREGEGNESDTQSGSKIVESNETDTHSSSETAESNESDTQQEEVVVVEVPEHLAQSLGALEATLSDTLERFMQRVQGMENTSYDDDDDDQLWLNGCDGVVPAHIMRAWQSVPPIPFDSVSPRICLPYCFPSYCPHDAYIRNQFIWCLSLYK